jgi:hypothetical protein
MKRFIFSDKYIAQVRDEHRAINEQWSDNQSKESADRIKGAIEKVHRIALFGEEKPAKTIPIKELIINKMNKPFKAKLKPEVLQAIQWTGQNHYAIMKFVGDTPPAPPETQKGMIYPEIWVNKSRLAFSGALIFLDTFDGTQKGDVGDFLLKRGDDVWICRHSIFVDSYEEVNQ